MPFINNVLEGVAIVARQAATASATAASSAATTTGTATNTFTGTPTGPTGPTGSNTFLPSSVPNASSSPTTSGPAATTSAGGEKSSGGSSPLLFFVALGFGVVFTNLWIIVGVKYCFRYNARARAMRQAAEDGEPINLENMPRPHRRRREKKLMTIDEVNEKFPMMKYKSWVASRAQEGLPTRGGVDAPSRPSSVRSAEGISALIPDLHPKERESTDETFDKKQEATAAVTATPADADASTAAGTSGATPRKSTSGDDKKTTDSSKTTATTNTAEAGDGSLNKDSLNRASEEHYQHSDDDDDEEHIIDAALPPELVGTSGDTCAICIDTLEDDDDVRGLTCGHAFHAVCLDPWLTSRRACCPLCKADYYTPKPRVPPAEGDATGAVGAATANMPGGGDARHHRMNMPTRPHGAWINIRAPGRMFGSNGAGQDAPPAPPPGAVVGPAAGGPAIPPPNGGTAPTNRGLLNRIRGTPSQSTENATGSSRSNWMGGLRPSGMRLPGAFSNSRSNGNTAGQPTTVAAHDVTPSQLEAGTR